MNREKWFLLRILLYFAVRILLLATIVLMVVVLVGSY